MSQIPLLFAMAGLVAAFLASVSIWSPRRPGVKLSALIAGLLFLPLAYAAFVELLSKPKPVAMEWWHEQAPEATVLGSSMREGEGIFLWLQLDEIEEPRSYVIPWDRELAETLQEALAEAEENDTGVRMRLPFEPSLDDREPKFYALPQPALPPKDRTDPPAQRFEAPGTDA